MGDHRAHPELDASGSSFLAARIVGGRSDVDDDRDLGLEPERRGPRAVEADLFLHCGDSDDVDRCAARLGDPAG